jgi:hypothetical protein
MGFLRRLRGGSDTQQLSLDVTWFTRIPDDAQIQVVGEAYRQEQVAGARPPGAGDLPDGFPPPPPGYFKALLVPEPTNPHDENAIRVALWAGRTWNLVGYLSRENAEAFQPLFRYLRAQKPDKQPALSCDAAKVRERGGVGIVLHLGTPGECIAELLTDDVTPTADHPWTVIVFTGDSETTLHGIPVDRQAQLMIARWAGCSVLPRVTKKIDALIAATGEMTGNHQKAIEYRIPIVAEADFLSAIGIPREAIGRVSGRWARA